MPESISRFIKRLCNLTLVQPWDLTATLGWSLVVGLVYFSAQSGILWLYFNIWDDPSIYSSDAVRIASVQANGILISIMLLAAASLCSFLVFQLVRRSGSNVRQHLALKPVSAWKMIGWMAILILFSLISGIVASYLEQDIVTDFTRNLYQNAGNVYLLAVAIVLAAPLFEELFFRGFMFFGVSRSRLGMVGAILVTALIWTVIHDQYNWYVRGNIFVIGILFGIARYKSGSILPPLAMHMLMNALALVEVANL